MSAAEVEALAAEIKALSPSGKLRLAADLLDNRRVAMAYAVADSVVVELGAVIALANPVRP